MGRILAIDYGLKRTGLAVTDPLRIIATALDVVETSRLVDFLRTYFRKEAVEEVVIGMPKRLNNRDSEIAPLVRKFVDLFKMTFPDKPIFLADERFTSSIACSSSTRIGWSGTSPPACTETSCTTRSPDRRWRQRGQAGTLRQQANARSSRV